MADLDDRPNDLQRKLDAIRRPPPPEKSTRWQKLLGNLGLWGGCAIALYYLIVVEGAKAGRGEARLYILLGVVAGGVVGWLIGLLIDVAINAQRQHEYDESWRREDSLPPD